MCQLKIYIYLIFISLFFSCEEKIDRSIEKDNQDFLVVDGIITNENKSHTIGLSYSVHDLNSDARPYSGAIVTITDSLNVYTFTEDINVPGNYLSLPFRALAGKKYYLTMKTETSIYTASASAVAVVPQKKIETSKLENENLYTIIYTESESPSMTEIFYNWSIHPNYCSYNGFCTAAETYYTLNNVDINETFAPEKQIIKFPAGTTIIRKTYSLTEDHQEFLRSLLMETDWRGGIFDVQQGNVTTNITGNAKGFFAVCMVVSDTTIIQ